MAQKNQQPAPALPSTTIVMLRDSDRGPELLMVKRCAGDAFGERYTFPGGVVDADESRAHPFCCGVCDDEANTTLNVADGGLDFYSAAVRELFEETGILLARDQDGDWPAIDSEMQSLRDDINAGRLAWSEFLEQRDLRIACDALHYFYFLTTPLVLPKRWAVRFFVAASPPGHIAVPDGRELTDSLWLTVNEAFAERKAGDMKIPWPTRQTLKLLRGHDSVASIENWARTASAAGVDEILVEM
jgi:8-oxo-dGTP pyrophosphatase MutT (NUDIX family)